MKFLSGSWKHLLLANYAIDPSVLSDLVPAKTSIDEYDGTVFVSLVAFLFDNTRVLGLPIPFHRRFEEVNLRFYVAPQKDPSIRGVTFIKEIVPKAVIPWIANSLFQENYVCLPMSHQFKEDSYAYSWGQDQANRFSGQIETELKLPDEGSLPEFITEHYWGYAKHKHSTREYHVTHPQWKVGEVLNFEIEVDFEQTYGPSWAFLNNQQPVNVLYAEGSAITVSFPSKL